MVAHARTSQPRECAGRRLRLWRAAVPGRSVVAVCAVSRRPARVPTATRSGVAGRLYRCATRAETQPRRRSSRPRRSAVVGVVGAGGERVATTISDVGALGCDRRCFRGSGIGAGPPGCGRRWAGSKATSAADRHCISCRETELCSPAACGMYRSLGAKSPWAVPFLSRGRWCTRTVVFVDPAFTVRGGLRRAVPFTAARC